MLKKRERLSRSEFNTLLQNGKRIHTKYFSVVFTSENRDCKCGLVVSKKVAKNAVKRNKLRRKVYAIFQQNKQHIKNKHIAVFTKPNITNLSKDELEKYLIEALKTLT